MLEMIFAKLGGAFIDRLFGGIIDVSKAVINKQITEIEAKQKMVALFTSAARDIEVAHSDDLAKTYASFMDAMKQSKIMQYGWATALYSQIFVLVWSQWAVPMLFAYGLLGVGWRAGTSAEWAYLIVVALLGMGPVVLRNGPGAGKIADRLKSLGGK